MRTKFSRTVLAAGFALALALISCAGSKPPPPDDGFEAAADPGEDLRKMCKIELKDYICGVGEAASTNSQMAKDEAELVARRQLAGIIESAIDAIAKRKLTNAIQEQAVIGTVGEDVRKISGTFRNVDIHEIKTMYNKKQGKYKAFVLVIAKRDDVKNHIQSGASNIQMLQEVAATKVFMDMIDEELNKSR